jgi:hypothetical protein
MARVKGAAPIKAEAKALLDQSNNIEMKDVVVAIEAKDEEEVGNEAAFTDSPEATRSNIMAEIITSGTTKAQEVVNNIVPAVTGSVRTVAYKGIYYLSYGITFGALVIARLVPAQGETTLSKFISVIQ